MHRTTKNLSKSAPIVKYYKLDTRYDGLRDVDAKEAKIRHYPDEYLIANLVKKYLTVRNKSIIESGKQFIVLVEPWFLDGSSNSGRDGSKNTDRINDLIYNTIEELQQAESKSKKSENTLILVPFLYSDRHPGVVIDINNKYVVYLHIYHGRNSSLRDFVDPEATALLSQLRRQGFKTQIVTAVHYDTPSCGTFLTNGMLAFIEEFIANGEIVANVVIPAENSVQDHRMFQMYLNNTEGYNPDRDDINEFMLADVTLWQAFLYANGITNPRFTAILEQFGLHQQALQGKSYTESDFISLKFRLISQLQSCVTECIFHNAADRDNKLDQLLAISELLGSATEISELHKHKGMLPKVTPQFWDNPQFQIIQAQLGLKPGGKIEYAPFSSPLPAPPESKRRSSPQLPQNSIVIDDPFQQLKHVNHRQRPLSLYEAPSSSQLLIPPESKSRRFWDQNALLAGSLKWAFTGVVIAAAMYFTFGFAAVPFIGSFLAQEGLFAIPLAGAAIGVTGGLTWQCISALYKCYVNACFAQNQKLEIDDVADDESDIDETPKLPPRRSSQPDKPAHDINAYKNTPPAPPTGSSNGNKFWANRQSTNNNHPLSISTTPTLKV